MKITEVDTEVRVSKLLQGYISAARMELKAYWDAWPKDLSKAELYEVIGGLLARQVTLATQLAQAPSTWNRHLGSLVFRAMSDVYINLAWILKDPLDRSQKFVHYGLGQEKLFVEHLKVRYIAAGKDPAKQPEVQQIESWINSQRWTFLTEVNLGHWAGLSTRAMAEEAGCLDEYNFRYQFFSGSTHSTWQHIARMNLEVCGNPLHRLHRVPVDPNLRPEMEFLWQAAQFLEKTFAIFRERFDLKVDGPSAFKCLGALIKEFQRGVRRKKKTATKKHNPSGKTS